MVDSPLWNIVAGKQSFAHHGDGSMTLSATDSQQSEIEILPPQLPMSRISLNPPPTGTGGLDGEKFCPASWPADLSGSANLRAPPEATLILKEVDSPTGSHELTKCGQYCSAAFRLEAGGFTGQVLLRHRLAPDGLVMALAITGSSGRDEGGRVYLDDTPF